MNAFLRTLPLVVLMALTAFFAFTLLSGDKKPTASTNKIGQQFSDFAIPSLNKKESFSPALFTGHTTLINIFASWCEPCAAEHASLMKLAQTGRVKIYGIAWKDKPEKITDYLKERGNPFAAVGVDQFGKTTIPIGLTGVPETFLLDKKGTVVYHYQTAITDDIVTTQILPLIERLNHADTP